jgi:hypothetical protein
LASLNILLQGLVGCVGLLSLICTGMIYIATQRELWGGSRTGFDFAMSTFGLGCVGSCMCIDGVSHTLLIAGVLVNCCSPLAKIVDFVRGLGRQVSWNNFSARSGRILRGELASYWIALWVTHLACGLMMAAIITLDLASYRSIWLISLFALCLLAQGIHRWLYFASVVFRRMPGAST